MPSSVFDDDHDDDDDDDDDDDEQLTFSCIFVAAQSVKPVIGSINSIFVHIPVTMLPVSM